MVALLGLPCILGVPAPRPKVELSAAVLSYERPKQGATCESCDGMSGKFSLLQQESRCANIDGLYDAMVRSDAATRFAKEAPDMGPFSHYAIMSVGCSLANDLVSFAQRFNPSAGYNVKTWTEALTAVNNGPPSQACGVRSPIPSWFEQPPAASAVPIRTVCVEAMPTNSRLINETLARFPLLAKSFDLVPVPFSSNSNVGTTVEFPNCEGIPGREKCGIDNEECLQEQRRLISARARDCPRVQLPVNSVDSYMQAHEMTRLDALFIRTVGHDPAVLEGAAAKLAAQTIRYLEFEVDTDLQGTVWSETRLTDVVGTLDGSGYSCYWMGDEQLVQITGCEFGDLHNHAKSSNVACVLRGDPWHSILESYNRGGLCEAFTAAEARNQAKNAAAAKAAAEAAAEASKAPVPAASAGSWALVAGADECPAGQRNAGDAECFAAVQEAVRNSNAAAMGFAVLGFKRIDDGPGQGVPYGCSYSETSKTALFNTNELAAGLTHTNAAYRRVCQ
jgi:hypothetical protein